MSIRTAARAAARAEHAVRFFSRVDDLAGPVVEVLGEALRAGGACVVLASSGHRAAFEAGLTAAGIDVAAAAAGGSWVTAEAAHLAERLVVGGRIDPGRFEDLVAAGIRRVASSARPVAVYGDVVAVLWESGRLAAAIDMEELGNRLCDELPVRLLCAYPTGPLRDDAEVEAFEAVCRLHSRVATCDDPSGEIREHWVFPREADAPGRARHFVVHALRRAGRAALCDDGALVATELASNAVRHARSGFSVTLSSRGDTVRIAVADASAAAPAPRRHRPLDTSGRGLALIAGHARRWGAAMAHDGKVVWAELQPR